MSVHKSIIAIVFAFQMIDSGAQASGPGVGGGKALQSLPNAASELLVNGKPVSLDSLHYVCGKNGCKASKKIFSPYGFTPTPDCVGDDCVPPELRKFKVGRHPKVGPVICDPKVCDPPKATLIDSLKSSGLTILTKDGSRQELWLNGKQIGTFSNLELDPIFFSGTRHTPVIGISDGTSLSLKIIRENK